MCRQPHLVMVGGYEIPTTQSGDFDDLSQSANRAVENLNKLLSSPGIKRSLKSLDETLSNLDHASKLTSQQIGPLMASLRKTSEQANTTQCKPQHWRRYWTKSRPHARHQRTHRRRALGPDPGGLPRSPSGSIVARLCRFASMMYYFVVVVLAAIDFGACGSSPPTQYYTLNAIASVGRSSNYAGTRTPVTIEKVIIPATLDRPQIVRRVSANRLDIDETERWLAPLDNIVQRVLTQDLASRMASGMVIQPGAPLPASAIRRVVVDITTFEGDVSGNESGARAISRSHGGDSQPARLRLLL